MLTCKDIWSSYYLISHAYWVRALFENPGKADLNTNLVPSKFQWTLAGYISFILLCFLWKKTFPRWPLQGAEWSQEFDVSMWVHSPDRIPCLGAGFFAEAFFFHFYLCSVKWRQVEGKIICKVTEKLKAWWAKDPYRVGTRNKHTKGRIGPYW